MTTFYGGVNVRCSSLGSIPSLSPALYSFSMPYPEITRRILRWYRRHGRTLPWRGSVDPYAIWVSEVMLQQTRVETVVPYYERFLSRFPTVESLAAAPLQDVLKVWENMGYYGRARNLHKAAGVIVSRTGGSLPACYDELIRLPGIGNYTASAILSLAFGKKVLALDGNVKRVICRLFALKSPLDERRTLKKIESLCDDLLPDKDSSSFNQALMDIGATICTPRNPACRECPLEDGCLAQKMGMQNDLPVRATRPPLPHRHMTAALLRDGRGRILVSERPARGLLGGLWKFPGGEKKPGESLKRALARTVREEMGMIIQVERRLFVVQHAFTHFRMSLHVFACRRSGGTVRAQGCAGGCWAGPRILGSLPFSKADRRILDHISFSSWFAAVSMGSQTGPNGGA
jgi:A/G-specific adenine glycosylase